MVLKDSNSLRNIRTHQHYGYEWMIEKGKLFHSIQRQLIYVESQRLATNHINIWLSWELWKDANAFGESLETDKEAFTWFQSTFETNYEG